DRAERRLRIVDAPGAFRQLGELERPGDALRIARDQLRLGRTADLSASDHVEQHGLRYRAPAGRREGPCAAITVAPPPVGSRVAVQALPAATGAESSPKP